MQYLSENIVDLSKYKAAIKDEASRIKTAQHFANQVMANLQGMRCLTGLMLPWTKTYQEFRFRTHELTVWAGKSGHGKSLLLGQVALTLLSQQQNVCILSLEMPPSSTIARLVRQACTAADPSIEFLTQFNEWTNGPLWIYDRMGDVECRTVVAMARYAWYDLGITDFIIDSLMMCGINQDDLNMQTKFIKALADHCHSTGQRVHLVVHPRKTNTRQDYYSVMTADDIAGSANVKNITDNLFIFHRNVSKEDEANKPEDQRKEKIMNMADAYLLVNKQRHGEWTGPIKLWYDRPSSQYVEYERARPIPYYNMLAPKET